MSDRQVFGGATILAACAGLLLFGASRALFVTAWDRVEARPAPTPATA